MSSFVYRHKTHRPIKKDTPLTAINRASKLKKGAKVRLSRNFKAIRAGCSGRVEFCHASGELSVGLTNTPEGERFQWLLPPLTEDYFERLKDGEIKDA